MTGINQIKEAVKKLTRNTKVGIARFGWKLIRLSGENAPQLASGLPDLCPTDNAEHAEHYLTRLQDLLINRAETVREIALTAPYSGGKSSVINTFMRQNPCFKYTCISLAAFKDSNEANDSSNGEKTTVNEEESSQHKDHLNQIEKSIVQQILYQTDSRKTPNSRFRRIYPAPLSFKRTLANSATTIVWGCCLALMLKVPGFDFKHLASGIAKEPSFSNFQIWFLSFVLAMPFVLLRQVMVSAHNLKLTKFSLTKGEVAFDQQHKDSIFNIYLEEIIYYFATTKHDVVIFEDLDRFERTDIFVKLKELNKLINDSSDVKQSVRFIYALRDDVFQGKSRTKFFDAIIPIIPISNKSNSYPLLKAELVSAGFEDDFDDKFIRDISVYLDDMRMLKNIVSEYGIYKPVLTNCLDTLDRQKLLGFIIYKNAYCDDFAKLHDGKGVFATYLERISSLKTAKKTKISKEVTAKKNQIQLTQQEYLRTAEELNAACIMLLIKNKNGSSINKIAGTPMESICDGERFSALMQSEEHVILDSYKPYYGNTTEDTRKTFRQLILKVEPNYFSRLKNIELRPKVHQLELEIRRLTEQATTIEKWSISQAIDSFTSNEVFDSTDNNLLLQHLLRSGYIDEQYHLYMAHFVEGLMTRSDMAFIRDVKDRRVIPQNRLLTIANAEETLEYLQLDDYRHLAFLNFDLITHLLQAEDNLPLKELLAHSIQPNENSLTILRESFEQLEHKIDWLNFVCEYWPSFWEEIIQTDQLLESDKNAFLVQLLTLVAQAENTNLFNEHDELLAEYISNHESIAEQMPEKPQEHYQLFDMFAHLGVSFHSLQYRPISPFPPLTLQYQLFDISCANIITLLNYLDSSLTSWDGRYSVLVNMEHEYFVNFMEHNSNTIVNLAIEDCLYFDEESDVINVFNQDDIEIDTKLGLIEGLRMEITGLASLKFQEELAFSLLDNGKLKPSWQNIQTLMAIERLPRNVLATFISKESFYKILCQQEHPTILDSADFSELLFETQMNATAFRSYIKYFKWVYQKSWVSKISKDKQEILILEDQFELDVYHELKDVDLSLLFLERKYHQLVDFENPDSVEIDETDFYYLLASKFLTQVDKWKLIDKCQSRIEINDGPKNSELIQLLCPVGYGSALWSNSDLAQISIQKLFDLIKLAPSEKEKVLILIGQLQHLDNAAISQALRAIGGDYIKIATGNSQAYIKFTDYNISLAKALDHFGYISSVSERKSGFLIDKIRLNLKKSAKL